MVATNGRCLVLVAACPPGAVPIMPLRLTASLPELAASSTAKRWPLPRRSTISVRAGPIASTIFRSPRCALKRFFQIYLVAFQLRVSDAHRR